MSEQDHPRSPHRSATTGGADDPGEARVVRRRRPAIRQRRVPRWLVVVGVGLLMLVLLAGAGGAWGLWSFSRFQRTDLDLAAAAAGEPRNYLVIGSDSREGLDRSDPDAAVLVGGETPGGRRSDSMEVVRVDPEGNLISLLSVPRDLWVPIASTGEPQRINTAYAESAQNVVDTVEAALGIPIHHFVEVDFRGFQDLVNTVGGVPMWFDHPVRDRKSGLTIPGRGCVVLDGYQGLAFARSRALEWNDGTQWVTDPTADLGRMHRQQILARAAMARVRSMGLNDLGRIKGLVDAARRNLTLDDDIGVSELVSLAARFANLDPDRIQTYSLPVIPHTTDGGAAVVLLDEAAAQPVLDVFRGTTTPKVTTTTAPPAQPSDLTVSVLNGSGRDGEARRVSYVLAEGGFVTGLVLSAPEPVKRTTVYYAPGGREAAELVASWIGPAPRLVEEDESAPGTLRIELGADFETVAEPAPPPESPGARAGEGGEPVDDGDGPDRAATTTTTTPGWSPGSPPPGVRCR